MSELSRKEVEKELHKATAEYLKVDGEYKKLMHAQGTTLGQPVPSLNLVANRELMELEKRVKDALVKLHEVRKRYCEADC